MINTEFSWQEYYESFKKDEKKKIDLKCYEIFEEVMQDIEKTDDNKKKN